MILPLDISALPEPVRRSIADLADRRGADRPLAYSDLREIEQAAEQLRRAYQDGEGDEPGPAHAHLPMSVGVPGAVLHRPTYGARIRLLQADEWPIPAEWADNPAEWANLVAGFCLAHAYDMDALAALADPGQARAVVETWAQRLPATCAQIADAVRTLTDGAYPPVDDEKKKDTGPKPSPPSSPPSPPKPAETPATGSGKSPSPTCAGCSAKSPAASVSRRMRRAWERLRRWTRRTPAPPPSDAGAPWPTD